MYEDKRKIKFKLLNTVFLLFCVCSLLLYMYKNQRDIDNSATLQTSAMISDMSSQLTNQFDDERVLDIINRIDEIPSVLLSALMKNEELFDYVYNYGFDTQDIDKSITKQELKQKIPLFIQWDQRWGYELYGENLLGLNGCGPTALSMILVSITGNAEYTPTMLANYSVENGYYVKNHGTVWSFMSEGAKACGVKSKELIINEEVVNYYLTQGNSMIFLLGEGDFTSEAHFVVVYDIDSEGKVTVNDPNSIIRSNIRWDLDQLLDQSVSIWMYYW